MRAAAHAQGVSEAIWQPGSSIRDRARLRGRLGIDASVLAREHERVETAGDLAAARAREDHPVVPPDDDVAKVAFRVIVVDLVAGVLEKHRELAALIEEVAEGLPSLLFGIVLADRKNKAARFLEEQGAVLVSEPYAYRNNVARGDTIELVTRYGEQGFPVAAVYQSYDVNASAVLMSRSTYDQFWDDPNVDSIGLYLSAGVKAGEVMQQLKAIGQAGQPIVVRSNREIRDLSLQVFDRTFVITDVLYWLATGVALIGILGAMLALQLERAREFAVLRALGMTPAQLGGMVTTQSAAIGLLSGLAAVPLGLLMAWVLIEVINRRAFGWRMDILIAPDVLLAAVLFAVGAALLAGIYPAYRAASSRPALAMREE